MEKWNVVGLRRVDFSDDSGKRITGYSLYVSRDGGPGMQGEECLKIFVSDRVLPSVPGVGDQIQIYYNRYGKVQEVEII